MREALGTEIELALDLGPGWMLSDAIVLARALEPFRLAWMEDMLTGDTMPYVDVDAYCQLTASTTSPTHTGEQLYLRNNYLDLISKRAVRVVGPDPADVGGIAELKWIGEFADLHSVMIAPHGVFDGVLGLAAQVQVGATMPDNYIAFEYPLDSPSWWYDIVEGLPEKIVNDGLVDVLDSPGLGVELIPRKAREHLEQADEGFFD
jgi:L-alanine-DL-glutamate epimerase-like enolase superfamily enzyme